MTDDVAFQYRCSETGLECGTDEWLLRPRDNCAGCELYRSKQLRNRPYNPESDTATRDLIELLREQNALLREQNQALRLALGEPFRPA